MQMRATGFALEIYERDVMAASRKAVRQLTGDCGNRPHERRADSPARRHFDYFHCRMMMATSMHPKQGMEFTNSASG
jgi:hypothetical protein